MAGAGRRDLAPGGAETRVSRILLVSMGVPAFVRAERHHGPGLRARHFAVALARAGHEVLDLAVLAEGEREPAGGGDAPSGVAVTYAKEKSLTSSALRAELAAFSPDAVVGVSAYAAALAARLDLDVPMWADIFGDLLAEAQAKAAASGSDWSLVHFWTLLRVALERGDRFSAVSEAQAYALVGELAMAGRLAASTAGYRFVDAIPCAAEADRTSDAERARLRGVERARLGIAADDFALLVSGGCNTWCDTERLGEAVVAAMEQSARLHLVATGGAIPGHDERSYDALAARLRRADRERLHLLGWVDSARLAGLYAAADLALQVEKPLYERALGAENRVIEWLAAGVAVATTAESEAGRALVRDGLAVGLASGSAAALAERLLEVVNERPALEAMALRGRAWVAAERGYDACAAPLVAWCERPRFAPDRGQPRMVRLGLLSSPAGSAEMLEAYVGELSTFDLLRRGARWVARRATGASRRGAEFSSRTRRW